MYKLNFYFKITHNIGTEIFKFYSQKVFSFLSLKKFKFEIPVKTETQNLHV